MAIPNNWYDDVFLHKIAFEIMVIHDYCVYIILMVYSVLLLVTTITKLLSATYSFVVGSFNLFYK